MKEWKDVLSPRVKALLDQFARKEITPELFEKLVFEFRNLTLEEQEEFLLFQLSRLAMRYRQ